MLFKKTGLPEEGELVLCTVTKVMFHSVFTNLDEYDKSGMIHISEISPGRIRNIRDFVSEGRKIVCKVLSVNEEQGHIDLSLRRVNDMQKREKIDWVKQEQKAEKIVEMVARKLEVKLEEVYDQISEQAFKKYDSLNSCFQEVVSENMSLEKLGIDKKIAKELDEAIRQRIKLPEVEIKGNLLMSTYSEGGVETVKESLKKAQDAGIEINYAGGGKYKAKVKAQEYKQAEKTLKEGIDEATKHMKKAGGNAEFIREEKKKKK